MSNSRFEEDVDLGDFAATSSEEAEEILLRRNAKRRRIRSMARGFREALTSGQCRQLAAQLLLPAASLQTLGLGWNSEENCYTFPERDGRGMVIGIALRPIRGRKFFVEGSSRGLTYSCKDWDVGDGPIFLVEGATDTAALVAMGLPVVGRPGNRGGVKHLVTLLEKIPAERKIVVVGDNDRKSSVGRDGAIRTAKKLSERLGRPIYWTLPPIGYKDSRQWWMVQTRDGADEQGLKRLGRTYAELLLKRCDRIELRPFEPYVEPIGKKVSLGRWRKQMASARLSSISAPGVFFDGSPTGAGKSFADRAALSTLSGSLTILPTHENCAEAAADLQTAGIGAVAYPKLDETTCTNWTEAEQALACGLSIPAAICPRCPQRRRCDYRSRYRAAKAAGHAVATRERAAKDFQSLAAGKKYIVIHESADALLRPFVKAAGGLSEVGEIASLAAENALMTRADRRLAARRFFRRMATVADYLERQLRRVKRTRQIKLPPACKRPSGTEIDLWRAVRQSRRKPSPDAMRVCWALAGGDIRELAVQVDHPLGKGGKVLTRKSVVAVWQTKLPDDAAIWFCDATGSAETIEKLSGRAVADKTPAGRLQEQGCARQITEDIKVSTSLKTVAGLLRSALANERDAQRVGVIGHRRHVCKLLRGDARLEPQWLARIVKTAYFGEGPDRSSNDWHRSCDLIIVLGTPRVPPAAIVTRLIQLGAVGVAGRDGQWGPSYWEGRDTLGEVMPVEALGYAVPDWAAAYRDLVRAELIQCIGRARTVCEDGTAVVVLSNEPCGLLISSCGLLPVNKKTSQLADAVNRLATDESAVSTSVLAEEVGISKRNARYYLEVAHGMGLIGRKGDRGGWTKLRERG